MRTCPGHMENSPLILGWRQFFQVAGLTRCGRHDAGAKLNFWTQFAFGGASIVFVGSRIAIQTIDGTITTHVLPSITVDARCISRQNLMSAYLTRFALGGASIVFVGSRIAIQTIDGTTTTHASPSITFSTICNKFIVCFAILSFRAWKARSVFTCTCLARTTTGTFCASSIGLLTRSTLKQTVC